MKSKTLLIAAVLIVSAIVLIKNLKEFTLTPKESLPQVAGVQATALPSGDSFVDMLNRSRADDGSSSVAVDPQLMQVAGIRADDMRSREYYAHVNPDGMTYAAYLQEPDGASCENLNLLESSDLNRSISVWLDSNSHRQCLLDSRYDKVGYATAEIFDQHLTVLILSE